MDTDRRMLWLRHKKLSEDITTIEYSFILVTDAPSVTSDPADVTVNEGNSVQFTCGYALTLPEPTGPTWRITDSTGNVRFSNETSIPGARQSRYSISSVQPSDAGYYTCLVSNEFDTASSQQATLTVHCKYQQET